MLQYMMLLGCNTVYSGGNSAEEIPPKIKYAAHFSQYLEQRKKPKYNIKGNFMVLSITQLYPATDNSTQLKLRPWDVINSFTARGI